MIDNLIDAIEEYLMSVLTGKDVSFKTFDEYRYHQYVTSKNTNSITGSIIILYSQWAYNTPALFNTSFIIIVGYTFCLDGPSSLFLVGKKWLTPSGQSQTRVTTNSFENTHVMQKLLNKKMCVCTGNFLEAAQLIVVGVENVKIFTTLCPNNSSFESNRLLFAHIQLLGYPEQISPYFVSK